MSDIIVADSTGAELRMMIFNSYDYEIGDAENSFEVECNSAEWVNPPANARIFIPGTELGGVYKYTEVNKKRETVTAGGFTWRGMLQKKIICPPSGQDYATDSGELNSLINSRVSDAFPGLFVGSSESTGVTTSYQYTRYCTLYDGLKAMLKSVGYKMQLSYDQELRKVVVSAVPISDFSARIEYSDDMSANYTMTLDNRSVNHLICLGGGELRDRTVLHLYADKNGVISMTQSQFDEDEVTEVYDYTNASDAELMESGIKELRRLIGNNENKFTIDLESEREVGIGDIVGSRDYLTGLTMKSPITTKVIRWQKGFETIEYKLSSDITVEQATKMSMRRVSKK